MVQKYMYKNTKNYKRFSISYRNFFILKSGILSIFFFFFLKNYNVYALKYKHIVTTNNYK